MFLSGMHVEGHKLATATLSTTKTKVPGLFPISFWLEGAFLYKCLKSHHFLFYPRHVREKLAQTLRMKGVTVPQNSELIADGSYSMLVGKGGGTTSYSITCTRFWNK